MYEKKIVDDNTFIVEFSEPVKAISSTIVGGGLGELTHVVFHRVDRDFNEPSPKAYARSLVLGLGLPVDTSAVFLTAVDVVREHVELSLGNEDAWIIATIGLSPLACIGGSRAIGYEASTINVLLATSRVLSNNALVDLVSLIASTKTLALVDLGLSCSSGGRVFSTITDAVIVASKKEDEQGPVEIYGGPATRLGALVAEKLYELILGYGLEKKNIHERFQDIFSEPVEWVVDRALEAYRNAPIPGVEYSEVRESIRSELELLLKDPNIWALGIAAKSLDYYGRAGSIPSLPRREYLADSKRMVADELLGISLALYINGWKALFSYYWIDRVKNSISGLGDKPMFIDDILASLIGSILSRVYDKYLTGRS